MPETLSSKMRWGSILPGKPSKVVLLGFRNSCPASLLNTEELGMTSVFSVSECTPTGAANIRREYAQAFA
jgi:hypothetical protein